MSFLDRISRILRWRPFDSDGAPASRRSTRLQTDFARTNSFIVDVTESSLPSSPVTHGTVQQAEPFLHNPQTGPKIWAYIGLDSPHRGDSHGYIGLARALAEQLQGQMVYVDKAMLDGQFPATMMYHHKLREFMRKTGEPDIIIGKFPEKEPHKATIVAAALNEDLTYAARKFGESGQDIQHSLVPHHLTHEDLAAAGAEFREHYPQLQGPVIAVFMTNLSLSYDLDEAVSRLAGLAKNNGGSTLFFCPCARTGTSDYNHIVQRTRHHLQSAGYQDALQIVAPSYEDIDNGYNPYRGLIDQAAATIMLGHSQSIVSETLFRGHRLYLGNRDHYSEILFHRLYLGNPDHYSEIPLHRLYLVSRDQTAAAEHEKAGYIRLLPRVAEKITEGPVLPPLDATPAVARVLAEEFNHFARMRTLAVQQRPNVPAALKRALKIVFRL